MYDHPRHPLRARTDLRRSGLDPGGVHAGDTAQPSGMGHVRLRLLLHRDLHLGGGVRLRRPSKQRPLGCRRLHLPRHRRLLLPQCFSGFGRRHPGDNRQELPELQAGRLRSGVLVRGDASLLLPHHPVGPSMEVFLEASEPTTQPIPKLRRADGVLPEEAVKKHLDHHGVSLRNHRNSSAVITDVAPHVSRFNYILKKCSDNANQRRRSALNVSWCSYRFVHSLILYCALCASFEDPRCRFCSFALVQWCNLEFL